MFCFLFAKLDNSVYLKKYFNLKYVKSIQRQYKSDFGDCRKIQEGEERYRQCHQIRLYVGGNVFFTQGRRLLHAWGIVLGEEETGINVREGADSLAAIYMTLPAGTEVTVLRQDGDWVMVFANEAFGFIYIDDLAAYLGLEEEEPVEGIVAIEKKVTIFTSRRTLMEEGEEIQLTSKLEGFEDCEEIRYVWKVDKGNGFEVVEGETGDTLTYTASLESLNWDWHLTVMYR